MNARLPLILGTLTALATTAPACDTCMKRVVIGKAEVLGNGLVWSWAKLDIGGKPISVGITMTETALEGLPGMAEMPKGVPPTMEISLDLPKGVKGLPFDHIGVDWNPIGHPPVKIYDVPHVDVHFYTISRQVRKGITMTGEGLKRAQRRPDARFVPAGYILPPDTIVPQMGAHWISKSAGELRGNPFTTTFLYGTHNGQEAFWEPMVTNAFLKTKPDFKEAIPAPAAYPKPGYYPTSYRVQYNATRKEYTIALDGLTYRSGVAKATAKRK
ncbi:MAG: DUF5602 domain-containing protein [Fimbriimonas sp.]